jgi:hypothetical protein
LVGGVKVILAAEVCEGSLLAELYRLALDEDGQGCGGRLFGVNFVVWKLIGTKFAGDQVKFEDLSECCNQVCLLLQAGKVAAEGEEVIRVCDCLCSGVI